MPYVDGFVLAVPNKNKEKYLHLAKVAAEVYKDHGAIAVVENWADDVPEGKITSFPMSVKCEQTESVVFSWITWPSKEIRDSGNKAAMEDPRLSGWDLNDMPFDSKRMIFGGFETILEK